MVVHTSNPSIWEAEAERQAELLQASLVYKVSSRIAMATQKNKPTATTITKHTLI